LLPQPATSLDKQNSFNALVTATFDLLQYSATQDNMPRNKLLELRDALSKDEASRKEFCILCSARGISLPLDYAENMYSGTTTQLLDMIEIADFYPKFILGKKNDNNANGGAQ
jgi:hypothetical protein